MYFQEHVQKNENCQNLCNIPQSIEVEETKPPCISMPTVKTEDNLSTLSSAAQSAIPETSVSSHLI